MNHNFTIEIEKLVLSSIIFNPILMDGISHILKAEDFFIKAHRDIFEIMLELHHDEMPIDEDFILKSSKKTIDESVLLNILSSKPITKVNKYVDVLKEESIRRQIQSLSIELKRESENENITNFEIFELLKDRQNEIISNVQNRIDKTSILDIEEDEPKFYLKDWLPIPQGTITMISAPGGTGKTWLIVQLALKFILENSDRKAFLWLSEDLSSIVKHRMKSICENIIFEELDERFKNIDITNTAPYPFLQKDKGVFKMSYKFDELKIELKEYDLIVLDPLLAFYGADENDNSNARLFMQPFMNWAKDTKKSIIFLHHSSKSSVNDNSSKSRGAGAFVDASRVCYELNKIYEKDNKTLDFDSLHLRDIKLSKDNYGAIKYLKKFNVIRHITPKESSKSFVEIVFDSII